MRIAVVGAGYVGCVVGACFAEVGHNVTLVEVDETKISFLHQGSLPFYEAGLKEMMSRNVSEGRLAYKSNLKGVVSAVEVVFIAVGTPQSLDGTADLHYVLQVAEEIARCMTRPLIVVNKSTVPVGTSRKVQQVINARSPYSVSVVSNPEFLKEGTAVNDFIHPDRVIIGTDDPRAQNIMADLYSPFVRTGNPILFMDNVSAELTKYCANGLLAARISFMNEIALLCDKVHADVNIVRKGIGYDKRISHSFLFPGIGYGGSCFPKDVRALVQCGKEYELTMPMLNAIECVNERQKHIVFHRVTRIFGESLSGYTFAIWGLAYKPCTDDIRKAPSLTIILDLLSANATVRVYDPQAMEKAKRVLGTRVTYCDNNYHACKGADALIVATEWSEFRKPDFERIKNLLTRPVIFDGRNIFDPNRMRDLGFEYVAIGRGLKLVKQILSKEGT